MNKNYKFGEFFLLLSQFFERIAHYSITANLLYMLISDRLNWENYNALAAPFLLNGFSFVSSVVGGILSDTYLRKTTTVFLGYAFYSTYIGFPYLFWYEKLPPLCNANNFTSDEDDGNKYSSIFEENCSNILLPSIIFSGIGSGLVRSVAASIGSDMASKGWVNPSTFFNMYYWCLNGGSLTALIAVSYAQQNISKRWGYIAPSIILGLSFLSFLSGGPYYIHKKKPTRSTIALVFKIYYEACWKKLAIFRKKNDRNDTFGESRENIFPRRQSESLFGEESDLEHDFPDMFNSLTKETSEPKKKELDICTLSKSNIINNQTTTSSSNIIDTTSYVNTENISFFDRCQIRFGGSFTENDVQDVRRFTFILAILFFMIPYYMIYFQMESTFMFQGIEMNINVLSGNSKYNIPTSWLIVVDIILIMFLLPLLVKCVYPWLKKKKLYLRHTTKIAIGFLFVSLSMIIAGGIETRRLYVQWYLNNTVVVLIDNVDKNVTNMSIFYQVPQYLVMGVSETLSVVAGLELACTQVSSSMQGLTNGLFWFASGLGSFVGSGSLYLFQSIHFKKYQTCIKDNVVCHLNYYFFILGSFIFIVFLCFILFLSKFRRLERTEHNQLLMRRISI